LIEGDVINYQDSEDHETATPAMTSLIDYYERKITLFFYFKQHQHIEQYAAHIVEIDMGLHFDQHGQTGIQEYSGYQNLFLLLFKKDKFFTPQFKISRKFSNIARNSLYIYWLQDESIAENSNMLQFIDESLSFKHLRGSVCTADSGHWEGVHENLKQSQADQAIATDHTILLMKPRSEVLRNVHHFKKIEHLKYIGGRSEVFSRLGNEKANENNGGEGVSLKDLDQAVSDGNAASRKEKLVALEFIP